MIAPNHKSWDEKTHFTDWEFLTNKLLFTPKKDFSMMITYMYAYENEEQ